ncbi:uncharacterized protein LOC144875514 [Branchiostoma floridae x Branchiostoma japonicum]
MADASSNRSGGQHVIWTDQPESMWNSTEDELDTFLYPNSTANSSDMWDFDFPLPRFTDVTMAKIIIVVVTFVLSFIGNVTFLITSWRLRRNRRARPLQSLLVHLAIADLIVTLVTMPSLGIWFYTVAWLAGNGMCKLIKSLQVLGLYLSTYLTVAISIDRCISVVKPMCRNTAKRRRNMVAVCWILSTIFSIPQAVIFHVESPVPDFQQCVTFGFYTAKWQEQLYNGLVLVVMYPIPLLVILICSVLTFIRLKKEGQDKDTFRTRNPTRQRLLLKARNNTLRTTAGIMTSFILCWTPYFVTLVWILFFNWQTVSPVVFDVLFLFGIFNSCVNPIVYGLSMFKKTTARPTLSLIEFSSPFLTRSERRSASVNSRISRTYSHVSLSTRRSWQPSSESTTSSRPNALNNQHSHSASHLMTGLPCRYGVSRQVRGGSQQKYLHPNTTTSPGPSTRSPKEASWHLKRATLTHAHSSPSLLTSMEKSERPNRRQSEALAVPTLPTICLTPPAESRNTAFFSAALCLLHDEYANSPTQPPVADIPYQPTAVNQQGDQHYLSRRLSVALPMIPPTPDTPGSWETSSWQFVGKISCSLCRYDSSSPSASYPDRGECVTGRPQVNARRCISLGNTDSKVNPKITERLNAEIVQKMRNSVQETKISEYDLSFEVASFRPPLPRLSVQESCVQSSGRMASGASIVGSEGSIQSSLESPLHSPASSVTSIDFRHRLSLCSFREGRIPSDLHSALRPKHYSDDNLKLSCRKRKAKRRVSFKTVHFLAEPTVSDSSVPSEGSNSSTPDHHQEPTRARNTSNHRTVSADIKWHVGCQLTRKTSSTLP